MDSYRRKCSHEKCERYVGYPSYGLCKVHYNGINKMKRSGKQVNTQKKYKLKYHAFNEVKFKINNYPRSNGGGGGRGRGAEVQPSAPQFSYLLSWDMLFIISEYLELKDIINIIKTCRYFYNFRSNLLSNIWKRSYIGNVAWNFGKFVMKWCTPSKSIQIIRSNNIVYTISMIPSQISYDFLLYNHQKKTSEFIKYSRLLTLVVTYLYTYPDTYFEFHCDKTRNDEIIKPGYELWTTRDGISNINFSQFLIFIQNYYKFNINKSSKQQAQIVFVEWNSKFYNNIKKLMSNSICVNEDYMNLCGIETKHLSLCQIPNYIKNKQGLMHIY